ncbi:MAG: barstar family protein [Balneola sp.]
MEKYFENNDYYIASIDGIKCKSVEIFLTEIGHAFSFPRYYGKNMDALHDCLTDLIWIKKDNYLLIINNYESFLSDDQTIKEEINDFLKEIADDWINYDGSDNDESRKKSDFVIIHN